MLCTVNLRRGVDFENPVACLDRNERMTRRITSIKVLGFVGLLVLGAVLIFNHTPDMFKVCLFSPVKGKVVSKGQPVSGAVIERSYDWAWGNKKGTDQTTTDQNGEFSFPAIHGTMILGQVAPHEPYIDQLITIKHEGRTYQAWATDKRNYEEFGELAGLLGQKPIELFCDLNVDPKNHDFRLKGQYGGLAELVNIQNK